MSRWILYVNKSYTTPGEFDTGSTRCLELVGNREDVLVQDVDAIVTREINLPPWLDHTPTIVDTHENSASKGSEAVRVCESLVQEQRKDVRPQDEVSDDRTTSKKVTDADVQDMLRSRQQQDEALGRVDPMKNP